MGEVSPLHFSVSRLGFIYRSKSDPRRMPRPPSLTANPPPPYPRRSSERHFRRLLTASPFYGAVLWAVVNGPAEVFPAPPPRRPMEEFPPSFTSTPRNRLHQLLIAFTALQTHIAGKKARRVFETVRLAVYCRECPPSFSENQKQTDTYPACEVPVHPYGTSKNIFRLAAAALCAVPLLLSEYESRL
jgi:hypothetical protein